MVAIIGALVLEAVVAASPLSPLLTRVGDFLADAAIALGVYGEMRFGGVISAVLKTRLAEANEELEQLGFDSGAMEVNLERATDELAQARRQLAETIERAAALEKEAAEARERTAQIERLTSRRHITMEQREGIVEAVRNCPNEIRLRIEFHASDPEAFVYAGELSTAFKWGGVTKRRIAGNSFLSGTMFGVMIASDGEIDPLPIIQVFANSEAPMRQFAIEMKQFAYTGEVPNLYIFVAPKPPPDLEPVLAKVDEAARQRAASTATDKP